MIARSSIDARIRSALLLCWADILNLLYYRVWFLSCRRVFRGSIALSAQVDQNPLMNAQHHQRCSSLGLSPFEILIACLANPVAIPDWMHFAGRRVALTELCRTSIALLRVALGLDEGDEVLVSAYNCGTEIDALLAAGLRVRCVDCDPQGMVTLEAIQKAVTTRTRALYIIHPFGWPQPLTEIDAWRRERALLLVEDCALSLFSSLRTAPRSERKVMPASSVSRSRFRCRRWRDLLDKCLGRTGRVAEPTTGPHAAPLASLSKAWVRRRLPMSDSGADNTLLSQSEAKARMEDIPANYYFEAWRANRRPCWLTPRLLANIAPAAIRERRRRNYSSLAVALERSRATLLYPHLPDGVCPLACPILVDGRDEIVLALKHSASIPRLGGPAAIVSSTGTHIRWQDNLSAAFFRCQCIINLAIPIWNTLRVSAPALRTARVVQQSLHKRIRNSRSDSPITVPSNSFLFLCISRDLARFSFKTPAGT